MKNELTQVGLARFLGVNRHTIRHWLEIGKIKPHRRSRSGRVYFLREDFENSEQLATKRHKELVGLLTEILNLLKTQSRFPV